MIADVKAPFYSPREADLGCTLRCVIGQKVNGAVAAATEIVSKKVVKGDVDRDAGAEAISAADFRGDLPTLDEARRVCSKVGLNDRVSALRKHLPAEAAAHDAKKASQATAAAERESSASVGAHEAATLVGGTKLSDRIGELNRSTDGAIR